MILPEAELKRIEATVRVAGVAPGWAALALVEEVRRLREQLRQWMKLANDRDTRITRLEAELAEATRRLAFGPPGMQEPEGR